MTTKQEVDDLVDAMGQLLDDMGKSGLSVCLYAKAKARIAFEPFVTDDGTPEMSLQDAKDIVLKADAR